MIALKDSLAAIDVSHWIQAACSLAAVFVAVWLARNSRRRRQNFLLLEEGRFAIFVHGKVKDAIEDAVKIGDAYQDIFNEWARDPEHFPFQDASKLTFRYHNHVIPSFRDINALPVDAWPNPELYIEFKRGYFSLEKRFDEFEEYYRQAVPRNNFARYEHEENMFGVIQTITDTHADDLNHFLYICNDYVTWCQEQGIKNDDVVVA